MASKMNLKTIKALPLDNDIREVGDFEVLSFAGNLTHCPQILIRPLGWRVFSDPIIRILRDPSLKTGWSKAHEIEGSTWDEARSWIRADEIVEVPCPACSGPTSKYFDPRIGGLTQVYRCTTCGAIHGHCYKGESYGIVAPRFATLPTPAGREVYFDLETLGSTGIERRHGWASLDHKDATTGALLLTQVG